MWVGDYFDVLMWEGDHFDIYWCGREITLICVDVEGRSFWYVLMWEGDHWYLLMWDEITDICWCGREIIYLNVDVGRRSLICCTMGGRSYIHWYMLMWEGGHFDMLYCGREIIYLEVWCCDISKTSDEGDMYGRNLAYMKIMTDLIIVETSY